MLQAKSLGNNRGFTLTEVLVAMGIMVVAMVGLLQALGTAFEHNLRNQIREEAVYLGEKYMNDLRGKPFERISTSYGARYVDSTVRGGGRRFTVERRAPALDTDGAGPTVLQLEVVVKWTHKGVEYQNRVVSPISRPLQ